MLLDGAIGENREKLLAEIPTPEEGANIGFLLCIEETDGKTKPYLVDPHGLFPEIALGRGGPVHLHLVCGHDRRPSAGHLTG